MRNSVQFDIVTIASQNFVLLAGVHFVADHLALGKEKTRWKHDIAGTISQHRAHPSSSGMPLPSKESSMRDVSTPSITILTVFTLSSRKDSETCCWEKIFYLRCAFRNSPHLNASTAGKHQPVRPTCNEMFCVLVPVGLSEQEVCHWAHEASPQLYLH